MQPTSTKQQDLGEAPIREAFDRGDMETAATLFIQQRGGEILSFLIGRMRDADNAQEVFGMFAEDFWRGLPRFAWRATMRSWAYTLARQAVIRFETDPGRRLARNVPLSQHSRFSAEVARLRSATRRHLRTEVKNEMRELMRRLPDDDQSLLVLRIDKQMSWRELAAVLSGSGEDLSEEETVRWAARLRKRFQLAKDRLRALAVEEGLLEG